MNRVEIVDMLFNLKETTALLGFMVTAVEAGGAIGEGELENALSMIYRTQTETIDKIYAALNEP